MTSAVGAPSIRPIGEGFGAEIRGIDLRQTDVGTPRLVADAVQSHRLVVVRAQALDAAAQLRLAATLGTLVAPADRGSRRARPEIRYEVEGRGRPTTAGTFYNSQWHADLSWCSQGARTLTLLYAVEAEPGGAPTAFVDTARAYDALDAVTQTGIGSWRAFHHVGCSRQVRHGAPAGERPPSTRLRSRATRILRTLGPSPERRSRMTATAPATVPPPGALHPVVQTDPSSGRRFVHLGDHAWTLEGVDEAHGRDLVDDLNQRIADAGRAYRHRWAPGDLLLWDNRSVLHRREAPTDGEASRALRRCVVWIDVQRP